MDASHWLLLSSMAMSFWCCALGWVTQAINYPLFAKVSPGDFVEYHRRYSKGIIFVGIAPTLLTVALSWIVVFTRPASIALWLAICNALFGLVAFGVTLAIQLPAHLHLQREGKSDMLIKRLVINNIIRALAFSGQAVVTLWMVSIAVKGLQVHG